MIVEMYNQNRYIFTIKICYTRSDIIGISS